MQISKTNKIIIWLGVLVVIVAGAYMAFYKKSSTTNNSGNLATTTDSTATTTITGGTVVSGATGGYKIEQVPLDEGKRLPQPIPDLNRPVTTYKGAVVAPEALAVAKEKIKSLQTRLKSNQADVNAWLDLGIHQKSAGDYLGTELSWKYAARLAPKDYVAFANLGNLYAYFLKDNAQAETFYKKAIENGPMQEYLYTQLTEVYRDVFNDKTKALTIVEQGLLKLPTSANLLQLKEALK